MSGSISLAALALALCWVFVSSLRRSGWQTAVAITWVIVAALVNRFPILLMWLQHYIGPR